MNLEDIGSHLRAARTQHGISLREMARRIDVSPSFVSQVELGRAKPSVGTLYAFVSELGLSLDELMNDSQAAPVVVPVEPETPAAPEPVAPSETPRRVVDEHPFATAGPPGPIFGSDGEWEGRRPPVQRADSRQRLQISGATWERLTNGDDPYVDFLHVRYSPGGESCPADHFIRHGGREYGTIITGRLLVQVAFDEYTLGPGDSIRFDSMTPHRLSNAFDEESLSIWVVVGRRGSTQL